MRLFVFVLLNRFLIWDFTVSGDLLRSSAIWLLEYPNPSKFNVWLSVFVSGKNRETISVSMTCFCALSNTVIKRDPAARPCNSG